MIEDIIRENNKILVLDPSFRDAVFANRKYAAAKECVRFCRHSGFDLEEGEINAMLDTGLAPNRPAKAVECIMAYGIGKTLRDIFLSVSRGKYPEENEVRRSFQIWAGTIEDPDLSWLLPAEDRIVPVFPGNDEKAAVLEAQAFWLSLLTSPEAAERLAMLRKDFSIRLPEDDLEEIDYDAMFSL